MLRNMNAMKAVEWRYGVQYGRTMHAEMARAALSTVPRVPINSVVIPYAPIQKVLDIRKDLESFDGDRRGIADCLCNAEASLVEACIIAMRDAAKELT